MTEALKASLTEARTDLFKAEMAEKEISRLKYEATANSLRNSARRISPLAIIASVVRVKIGNDEINVRKFSRNLSKKIRLRKTKTLYFMTIARQAPRKRPFNPSNEQFPSIGTTKLSSSDPSEKLDKPRPTHPTASWIDQWRVGSVLSKFTFLPSWISPEPCILVSRLPSSGLGQTVSCHLDRSYH
ncbi:hypothetical protein F2Q68_00021579 [Brassica cretica]|uniref:Uncharacterized protein n=1 Tax=Brassica cretica TaxID=69181 RepID=A0A8S9FUE2_BRACR|nr:hypothetical protein F2Q68_00021579 [Brassica cretica]